MQTVYILKCSDTSFYTGCTSDLDERIARHNAGYVESTKKLQVSSYKLQVYEQPEASSLKQAAELKRGL
jgi:predicted GIY-YIG superfamily endonuclease